MKAVNEEWNKKIEEHLRLGNQIRLDEDADVFSQEEMDYIKTLYLLYEFSDKVRMCGEHVQFGGLHNYVSSGILTEEEVRRVL